MITECDTVELWKEYAKQKDAREQILKVKAIALCIGNV